MNNLREKFLRYTDNLSEDVDLRQEAIATIEQAAQYMEEDVLLHHSRALALAYLALTDGTDGAPVVRCRECDHLFGTLCAVCGLLPRKPDDFCSYGERKEGAGGEST